MANVINVNQTEDTIEVEVGTDEITIEVGAISNMQAFVESDVLFSLNGPIKAKLDLLNLSTSFATC